MSNPRVPLNVSLGMPQGATPAPAATNTETFARGENDQGLRVLFGSMDMSTIANSLTAEQRGQLGRLLHGDLEGATRGGPTGPPEAMAARGPFSQHRNMDSTVRGGPMNHPEVMAARAPFPQHTPSRTGFPADNYGFDTPLGIRGPFQGSDDGIGPDLGPARRPNAPLEMSFSGQDPGLNQPLRPLTLDIPVYRGEPDRLILDQHFRLLEKVMIWKGVSVRSPLLAVQQYFIAHSATRFKSPEGNNKAYVDAEDWASLYASQFDDYWMWKKAVYETFLPHNYEQLLYDDWEFLSMGQRTVIQFAYSISAVNMRLQNAFSDVQMRQKLLSRLPQALRSEMDRVNTSTMLFRDVVSMASRLEKSVLNGKRGTSSLIEKAPIKSAMRQVALVGEYPAEPVEEPLPLDDQTYGENDLQDEAAISAVQMHKAHDGRSTSTIESGKRQERRCFKCGSLHHLANACKVGPSVNLVSSLSRGEDLQDF